MLSTKRFVALLLCACATAAEAGPEATYNPVPDPIARGIRVGIEDFLTVPYLSPTLYHTRAQNIQPMGDRAGRLAINDTGGVIWTTTPGAAAPTMFLDLRDRTRVAYDNSFNPHESGLHGLAFHPNYGGDPAKPGYGKFYTGVSVLSDRPADFHDDGNVNDSIVVEWSTDPRRAIYTETAAPRELLRIGDAHPSHNVGTLAFNPTARPGDPAYGALHIAYGDGGRVNDPDNLAANLDSPWGKILRILPGDPDGAGPGRYGIPADNPFVGRDGLDEVLASGFRHPQHMSFDPVTGALYSTDFGESFVEEVNRIVPGGDYGWQRREGTFRTAYDVAGDFYKAWSIVFPLEEGVTDGYVYPVAQFDHDEGTGISSAHVYRGSAVPELFGKLVISEIQGRLFYAELGDLGLGTPATLHEFQLVFDGLETTLNDLTGVGPTRRTDLRIGFDQYGELYLVTKPYGRIFRFVTLEQVPAPPIVALFGLGLVALGIASRARDGRRQAG